MASEQQGFVFAVVFMVVFSSLLAAWPAGLQGLGETVNAITPVDPSLLTDFTAYVNYTKAAFNPITLNYDYNLGERDWTIAESENAFYLAAKQYVWIFWLGGMDSVKFTTSTGTDRGQGLSFAEIAADADNGSIRYYLTYVTDGTSAGGFIAYWNTTLYSDPEDAWDNNALSLIHGVGVESTTGANILGLLFSLLFLQLPDVPILVGILLAVGPWASIIYIIWFLIKEMIPFL